MTDEELEQSLMDLLDARGPADVAATLAQIIARRRARDGLPEPDFGQATQRLAAAQFEDLKVALTAVIDERGLARVIECIGQIVVERAGTNGRLLLLPVDDETAEVVRVALHRHWGERWTPP
jgi:hypothetical protein